MALDGVVCLHLMVIAILTLFCISFVLHLSWLYYTALRCQYFILVIRTIMTLFQQTILPLQIRSCRYEVIVGVDSCGRK